MSEHAVVSGEYITFKHVKTRKVVVLEIEVPEERFQDVINKLGMPVGGESKPVAVCLLDSDIVKPITKLTERTEGEKLVVQAVLTCKDASFQRYIQIFVGKWSQDEQGARQFILDYCEIESRSELATNRTAQKSFKSLDKGYKNWLNPVDKVYADNLTR